MIREQAPGKLFIAGEYAVVEPGQPAVLVAVDRFVTVELTETEGTGSIWSDQYGRLPLVWTRRDDQVVVETDHRPYDYVFSAIATLEQLAIERGVAARFYDIRISSQLDDVSGRKFGLGSSAAVTVATVRALSRFHGLDLSDRELFQLALIATVRVSPSASGGDVAASTYGGWIAYSAPDRAMVRELAQREGITQALRTPWPGLSIRPLPAPRTLDLLVGWTVQPASTERLVGSMQHSTGAHGGAHAAFLADSRRAVDTLVRALDEHDDTAVCTAITAARAALADLARHAGIGIETPRLRELCEAADRIGAAGKSSGAGGGDCGIVLAPHGTDVARMLTEWEQHDIRHLAIGVHEVREATHEQ